MEGPGLAHHMESAGVLHPLKTASWQAQESPSRGVSLVGREGAGIDLPGSPGSVLFEDVGSTVVPESLQCLPLLHQPEYVILEEVLAHLVHQHSCLWREFGEFGMVIVYLLAGELYVILHYLQKDIFVVLRDRQIYCVILL